MRNAISVAKPMRTRRQIIRNGVAFAACMWPGVARSGPFDTLGLDRRARILKQGSITIPAQTAGSSVGIAGFDIIAPGRGYIGVDWVISGKREITLMLATAQQKAQLVAGAAPRGDPLMR